MKIARVTGTVTATVKDSQLVGLKFLLTDIIDAEGDLLEAAVVAVDTCGAGVGDQVLLVSGSAARIPASVSTLAVDATIVAIIDDVSTQK